MFKSLKAGLLALTLLSTTALAEDEPRFYNVDINGWLVTGNPGNKDVAPFCTVSRNFNDGSYFNFVKDLGDGELVIFIKNVDWNIGDPVDSKETLIYNSYASNKTFLGSLNMEFFVVNKNSIIIRHILSRKFIPYFADAGFVKFIMPGTIQNLSFSLEGSASALGKLVDCIDAGKNVTSQKPVDKPATTKYNNI